ncbi:hypothetical protein VOLCADRAFT_120288 [Volvox carteri f. nagariensis]|uniref:Uncharacterized protein n=1 Tax=Volvox carteri f. nagariensis TaxID=3068 RepID=D8TJ72_VOLCA|nr:uncharacterized protein VOLCADRAFT_120288 [Volvox carteri f. nagariensis]EFJ52325.1 hypothetical protein VOLCADRAFT_120288 [Volvox carteri f. nagariensis]|eukprot:XP_002946398.1 hypothetical protein VOLCADRAFT_120288 [Volvox carteri f. nagariensis]
MELQAQHALVQAVDLLLCEAMQAVLRGERGPGIGLAPLGRSVGDATAPELPAQSEALTGDFDSLLQARHPSGDYLSAARAHSRRGEDVAQDAARAVQVAKEQLEQQMGPFARQMDDAATALAAISSARTAQCDNLRTRADAAAVCVARARSKLAAQRAARDSAAAEKYSRAAEGWAKQAEKLRKEALVTSAAAEEMGSRGQAIARLGARLRPIQEALDEYLDQQLEAWAAAALSRIQACGLRG